jgi:hypothetical protein
MLRSTERLCKVLISRQIGKVEASTHMDGLRVYQDPARLLP